jgi:hypothetical protein
MDKKESRNQATNESHVENEPDLAMPSPETTADIARAAAAEIDKEQFTIDCTGDVCTGDVILFSEGVFAGSYRKPRYVGDRWIAARVLKESYGSLKQQHTFTVEVLDSGGTEPLSPGTRTTRKGRNIYRAGTLRQPWADETERQRVLADKHQRGNAARLERRINREWQDDFSI